MVSFLSTPDLESDLPQCPWTESGRKREKQTQALPTRPSQGQTDRDRDRDRAGY